MVSARPLISKSSSPCTNPLVTVPGAPITIAITVTFMFHSLFVFFSPRAKSQYLSFFPLNFSFTVVNQDSKVHNSASSLSTCFSFRFLLFLLCSLLKRLSSPFSRLSFFLLNYHKVWSSSWDYLICLYRKILLSLLLFLLSFICIYIYILLYSLHNGHDLLHKYTSTERQRGWPNPRVWSASPVVWGKLWSAMFWSARLGRVEPQHWRFPPASGGRPPRLLPPFGGLGLLPGARRNADGAEGIFGNAGRVWAAAQRLDPPLKKSLVLYSLVRWGAWQITWPDPRDTATCDTTCVVGR